MYIAHIGTGRVGRPTAYTIICAELTSTITVCDTRLRLTTAFAEELQHVATNLCGRKFYLETNIGAIKPCTRTNTLQAAYPTTSHPTSLKTATKQETSST